MSESVWDYPRPPRVEATTRRVRVVFDGATVADTTRALRVLETSHPPVYYIPPEDVRTEYLRPSRRHTFCEFKGEASYFDLVSGGGMPPTRAAAATDGAAPADGATATGDAAPPDDAAPPETVPRRTGVSRDAAWYYADPSPGYEALRDHVAFYPSRVDAAFVDGEQVTAQAGDFYGGWITADVTGPFKGGRGTAGW